MSILLGIFFILHALVHLLYAGQALRFFELRPGMTWPDGSWVFSRLLGDPISRWVATIILAAAALSFIAGGLGLVFGQQWWQNALVGAIVFSTTVYLLFWNGKFQAVDDQGGVGILINLAIFALILIRKWPA